MCLVSVVASTRCGTDVSGGGASQMTDEPAPQVGGETSDFGGGRRLPTPCVGWVDPYQLQGVPVPLALRELIPADDYLILPVKGYDFNLGQVTEVNPSLDGLEVNVADNSGGMLNGHLELFDEAVVCAPGLSSAVVLWRGSEALSPGGSYSVSIRAANTHCERGTPLDTDFRIAIDPLMPRERAATLPTLGEPAFEWDSEEPDALSQCCQARTPDTCPDDTASCVACAGLLLTRRAVVEFEPFAEVNDVYWHYEFGGSEEAEWFSIDPTAAMMYQRTQAPFEPTSGVASTRLRACAENFCIRLSVDSAISDEFGTTEPRCLPVPDDLPMLPAPWELFEGNPCADDSGPQTWRLSDPPQCWQYPGVRWFDNMEAAAAALGGG